MFAPIRFHDTINRGRLLNRFGKDFEGIDSSLIDSLGRYVQSFYKVSSRYWYSLSHRSVFYLCSVTVIIITVTWIGGLPFFIVFLVLAMLYFEVARVYGQTARDMRRLGMSVNLSLHAELTPSARLCRPLTPLFNIRRDCRRGASSSCFWGLQQVYERHAPLCGHSEWMYSNLK